MVTAKITVLAVLATLAACGSSKPTGGGAMAGDDDPGTGSSTPLPGLGSGLGSASFAAGDLDPASDGGSITFQQIGAAGSYPSVRDPASGACDAFHSDSCCLATKTIAGDQLTPWDEDLIMTLRGPMQVKQLAVYQPAAAGGDWALVSSWDDQQKAAHGLGFSGNSTETAGFPGTIGTECLVNVSTDQLFGCGAGSSPYCQTGKQNQDLGWAGSKLFVVLARMPGADAVPGRCSTDNTGNWFDAPWIGLSVGELVRAGSFSSCQCYAQDPAKGYLGDGCGQFNVFEVVNDNNSSKNLDVFSTNFIGYGGYVGQGPCGGACNAAALAPAVDLIDKAHNTEAAAGAIATPSGGPSAALRRPEAGYRYFVILLDVASRQVQLAIIHPGAIPSSLGSLLPALPAMVPQSTIDGALALRLPR
jgi:hypothetical protein